MARLDDIGLCLHSLELGEFSGFSENSADLSKKYAEALRVSLSSSLVTDSSGPLPSAAAVPPSPAQSGEPLPSTSLGSPDCHFSFAVSLTVQNDLSAPFGPDDARA